MNEEKNGKKSLILIVGVLKRGREREGDERERERERERDERK